MVSVLWTNVLLANIIGCGTVWVQFSHAHYFYQKVGECNEQGAANFLGETGQNMQLPYANNTLAFTITYNSEQYEEFDDAEAAFAPQFSAIEQV